MINIKQLRTEIIEVALKTIGLYSVAAEELVLGTGFKESGFRALRQYGGGPALGFFQMEPVTHDDIWLNYLSYHPEISVRLDNITNRHVPSTMIGNMWYAAAMCRIHYYRVPAPLPPAGDLTGQAAYWKTYYNTPKGKGTAQQYINAWKMYMES